VTAPLPQAALFDQIDVEGRSLTRVYEERLSLVEAADAAGFRSYHLAEHHFTPLGVAPSPSVFLAAAAQRTVDIRLGAMVYVLPLHNPQRLYEEICMLDHLSGGRVEVGVGAGASPHELRRMGIDPATARDAFRAGLERLVRDLRGGSEQVLAPVQRPNPPIWYPCANPDRLPWVAEAGFHAVVAGPDVFAGALTRTFREVAATVPPARRINPGPGLPLVALLRTVFVAETDAAARELAGAAFAQHAARFAHLWRRAGGEPPNFTASIEGAIASGEAIVGSPATVRERLAASLDATTCDVLLMPLAFGDLPAGAVAESLAAFAAEVAPGVVGLRTLD
jgi:alkanesulfonate monooxygenase SsuD/methylene tetrahydromethanopterin reductase-like flavin-dependent oxidoreductase (luciferase family)